MFNSWRVGIEKPVDGRVVSSIIDLNDMAIATSGNYRNFIKRNGQTFSHTIDPRTALPVQHRLASVTVLHKDCMMADGYATALMAMGPEESWSFAKKHKLAVHFMINKKTGLFSQSTDEFMKKTKPHYKKKS